MMKNIILLRSADVKTTLNALEKLKCSFPDARIHLLVQRNIVSVFKETCRKVVIIEYPYRDFNLAAPDEFFRRLPRMDIAFSLYKNDGNGYDEVDAFLLNKIRSSEYGSISGSMEMKHGHLSQARKKAAYSKNMERLYRGSSNMKRSISFSKQHCPATSRVVFTGDCQIIVDEGGKFEMSPESILRIGHVPPDWEGVRKHGGTVIRIQRGAIFKCLGSVTLYSGIRINIFPGAELMIGDGTYIAFDTSLFVEKSVEIGRNCAISWDVEFMDTDFHRMSVSDNEVKRAAIVLNDHVWIGAGARILKNVELGGNSVVAASSVVTKPFPGNSIIAGNPAKLVGTKEGSYRI